jgi:DnaJ-class molecular chaperone
MLIRNRSQALVVLKLPEDAEDAVIKAHCKKLLMDNHPDKGGDVEVFMQVCRARDFLLRKVCPLCEGSGIIRTKMGRMTQVNECSCMKRGG